MSDKHAIAQSRVWSKHMRTDAIATDFNHWSHLSAPFLGSLEKNFINGKSPPVTNPILGTVKGLTAVHVYNWIYGCVCVLHMERSTYRTPLIFCLKINFEINRIKTSNSKSSQGIQVFFFFESLYSPIQPGAQALTRA